MSARRPKARLAAAVLLPAARILPATPAPAATAIRPSAPFSIALRAKVLLITSCSTTPP